MISFTLDPMLSAYWGDPPNHHTAPKGPVGRKLQVFNDWFDRQADRYAGVIAWALHHRRAMGLIALSSLIAAIALHMRFGGSAFLPAADSGNLMIDVRTPASSSLEYARLKMERAAEIARTLPETRETNSNIGPNGGRIYVDLGPRKDRRRSAKEVAVELREKIRPLIGAEFTVFDDLGNGARKPVQIDFTGPDSRRLLEITNRFMENCARYLARWMWVCRSKTPAKNCASNSIAGWPTPWGFLPMMRPKPCASRLRGWRWATG
jgi:multidrug efflux pump subunit AcrB